MPARKPNLIEIEGNISTYLGVSWCNRDQVWRAQRTVNGNRICLGSFKSETDAAMAYDAACAADPFASLNFGRPA